MLTIATTGLLLAMHVGQYLPLATALPTNEISSLATRSTSLISCAAKFISYNDVSDTDYIQLNAYDSDDNVRAVSYSYATMEKTNKLYSVDCKATSSEDYCYVTACGPYGLDTTNKCAGSTCHVKATCGETYEIEALYDACAFTKLDLWSMTLTGKTDEGEDSQVTINSFDFVNTSAYVISDGGNFSGVSYDDNNLYINAAVSKADTDTATAFEGLVSSWKAKCKNTYCVGAMEGSGESTNGPNNMFVAVKGNLFLNYNNITWEMDNFVFGPESEDGTNFWIGSKNCASRKYDNNINQFRLTCTFFESTNTTNTQKFYFVGSGKNYNQEFYVWPK
eukprot:Pgem_evm1s1438